MEKLRVSRTGDNVNREKISVKGFEFIQNTAQSLIASGCTGVKTGILEGYTSTNQGLLYLIHSKDTSKSKVYYMFTLNKDKRQHISPFYIAS